jgi:nicotinate-nucleotide pyrophosphorylase (carboxylating)
MDLAELVRLALQEDVGNGDLTTIATVTADRRGRATVTAKQPLVVCGHEPATEVYRQLGATWTALAGDGEQVARGTVIAEVQGPLRALLTGERLALNFLMRLSGIATHTRTVVAAAEGQLTIVDTRKTTPLNRRLERAAVVVGGGRNHRFALYDGILIKDNHIVAAGGIHAAVSRARQTAHHLLRIEVEVESLNELDQALEAGADAVLLDNMDVAQLSEAVRRVRSQPGGNRITIEASGNMDATRIAAIRHLDIDVVSVGGLIHQAVWADLSMRIQQD